MPAHSMLGHVGATFTDINGITSAAVDGHDVSVLIKALATDTVASSVSNGAAT